MIFPHLIVSKRSDAILTAMKNPGAVALGKKRGRSLKRKLADKGISDYMRALAHKRHGTIDKAAE
jgi:hypothetical protein